jgi:hypothetical protein
VPPLEPSEWLRDAGRLRDLLLAAGCKSSSLELDGSLGDGPQADVQAALETLHPLLASGGCTSLSLSGLDLGTPDSLDCLAAKELPQLYTASIHSCSNVSAQHLRAIARLAAPRLGNVIFGHNRYLEGGRPGRTQLFEGLHEACGLSCGAPIRSANPSSRQPCQHSSVCR